MGVVTCYNVTKMYRRHRAINQLSVNFKEQTITGLIGRNGAGKTSLLKMIAGLTRPTSGDLEVFGEHPFNSLKVSANSIFVDDQMVLPPDLTVSKVLRECQNFYPNWDKVLADRLINYFSISLDVYPDQLSKGKRSTFHAIIGMASRVPLTIFDEPTTGMDYSVRQDFYRALLKDYLEHPRTVILSSHLLNELEDLLEEIILINDGGLKLHESMADLKEYAIGLIGQSSVIWEQINEEQVIYRKNMGSEQSYIVVKNDLSSELKTSLHRSGVQLKPVSPADLCVYITNQSKGGIDDVFDRDES
ncbi:ATP-binding cassette domain-containing protein [Alkalibacillus aidingensis]|uniref:ATP-binding cassette domain-containing protein n=1 Tax=Alkalibacillus aidingensis TaxID=2747607 RepID=UPI001660F5CA|nr:ABC transporter ATP-binding protein [Alkalibacillus aidingensis]